MSRQVDNRTGGQLERRRSRGLRPMHTLAVVAVGVVGVLVAFWALSFIAGLVWGVVKVAVIVAVIAGVLWLFLGRRRR
jgi:putative flippase GtrA